MPATIHSANGGENLPLIGSYIKLFLSDVGTESPIGMRLSRQKYVVKGRKVSLNRFKSIIRQELAKLEGWQYGQWVVEVELQNDDVLISARNACPECGADGKDDAPEVNSSPNTSDNDEATASRTAAMCPTCNLSAEDADVGELEPFSLCYAGCNRLTPNDDNGDVNFAAIMAFVNSLW